MQLDQAKIAALAPGKFEWPVALALKRKLRIEKQFSGIMLKQTEILTGHIGGLY